jgi:hypothetical protein
MEFAVICLVALIALGVAAAIASHFSKGDNDAVVIPGHDCAGCLSADDGSCKLHCLIEEKKRREGNKTAE